MTITEFLEARIAEDEAVARAAAGWTSSGPSPEVKWIGEPGDHLITRLGVAGPHIASFSPARVLAECAAKRAILAGRERIDRSANDGEWSMGYSDANYEALRALAAVYASHPNYRQEWSVA